MPDEIKSEIEQKVEENKNKPIPLAEALATEEGMRRVVQVLAEEAMAAKLRLSAIEQRLNLPDK